jgi:SnoaL-like domain
MTHNQLRSMYQAFNARDIDAILVFMRPDVDWPNGMEGGRVYGHRGVREYWQRQWRIIDPQVEPQYFQTDEMGRIAVKVHQVVRALDGGLLSDKIVQHTYSLEDGLIKSMEISALEQ